MQPRLSVLDQSPVSEGMTVAQALRNTIERARHADALGFHRYWVAAEEAIVVTITYDHGARLRSYELIAEAFGLTTVRRAA